MDPRLFRPNHKCDRLSISLATEECGNIEIVHALLFVVFALVQRHITPVSYTHLTLPTIYPV